MVEDTNERRISAEDFAELGVPTIDPGSWEDPKITFPGIIEESYYRFAPDTHYLKQATDLRKVVEADIPQWYARIRRLDAIVRMPDGSEHAAMARFWGIDLQKWSNQEKTLVPISARFAKEFEIQTAFKEVFGAIHPPESLVGKKALFDFYDLKSVGQGNRGSFKAKNVLLPTELLDPDYEFDGELRIFEGRVYEEDSEGTSGSTNNTGSLDSKAVYELLANWYVEQGTVAAASGNVSSLPTAVLSYENGRLAGEVAGGEAAASLIGEGLLVQEGDGTLSRA